MQTSAFKSGNTDDRKQASYDLRKSIKAAKRQYKNKVEVQLNTNNARNTWQGINNITGFKGKKTATVNITASLPDELNNCYAPFEAHNTTHTESAPATAAKEVNAISFFVADVIRSFKRVNIRKDCGYGWHPRPCAQKMRIPNSWVLQTSSTFPSFFLWFLHASKKSTIVPIPKKNKIPCMNDSRPVALTPIFSKCFEKLIRDYICSVLPASLDPLQFAYFSNRSTDDAIAFTCTLLSPTWKIRTPIVRILFVDYSSVCNTIVPATLAAKLQTLGLNRSLRNWILDSPWQAVRWSEWAANTRSPLVLNTWCSAGLRPQPTPLLPVHKRLYSHTQLQHHHKICRWHNGDRPDHRQWWDSLQRGGEYPD